MSSSQLSLAKNVLPEAPSLRKLLGPSFILLGLGLGSGEIILWPYLASNFGLGIIWGAVIGITLQFFINMEVERWALVNGESIFVGFARLTKWLPLWFIFSTFAGFGWPGIGLAGAQLLGEAVGVANYRLMGVIVFILIGLVLSIGKILYNTVENLQKHLILVGVPLILLVTILLTQRTDLLALLQGFFGVGRLPATASLSSPTELLTEHFPYLDSYFLLPASISLTTFLGALAYSGAGGNLNLAQSFYVRDKGYGMGKYATRITSIFRQSESSSEALREGGPHDQKLSGTTFDPEDQQNLDHFKNWWQVINREHLLIFWVLGLFTMLLLSLLAYATTFGLAGTQKGISFLLTEAQVIATQTFPVIGTIFLLIMSSMLLSTQLGVLETTSRIITENLLLLRVYLTSDVRYSPSKAFYVVLWVQIIFGITVFLLGFDEPRALITLGAVLNAFAMFVYIGIILYLNNKKLHPNLQPSKLRNFALATAWVFFGIFSALTLYGQLG